MNIIFHENFVRKLYNIRFILTQNYIRFLAFSSAQNNCMSRLVLLLHLLKRCLSNRGRCTACVAQELSVSSELPGECLEFVIGLPSTSYTLILSLSHIYIYIYIHTHTHIHTYTHTHTHTHTHTYTHTHTHTHIHTHQTHTHIHTPHTYTHTYSPPPHTPHHTHTHTHTTPHTHTHTHKHTHGRTPLYE